MFFNAIKIPKSWGPYSTTKWYTWRWPRRLKNVGVIKYICDTWMCTSLVISLENLAKICKFNHFINPMITTKRRPSSFQQSTTWEQKSKVYHCSYQNLSLHTILRQSTTITTSLYQVYLHISLYLLLGLPNGCFLGNMPMKILYALDI